MCIQFFITLSIIAIKGVFPCNNIIVSVLIHLPKDNRNSDTYLIEVSVHGSETVHFDMLIHVQYSFV